MDAGLLDRGRTRLACVQHDNAQPRDIDAVNRTAVIVVLARSAPGVLLAYALLLAVTYAFMTWQIVRTHLVEAP